MNIKEFAKSISGKEYGYPQFTKEEIEKAKENGFIIAYCSCLKWIEFDGSMRCTADCLEGVACFNLHNHYIPGLDDDISFYKNKISVFCGNQATWSCETEIPHETFMIYEGGEPYCRGIVFSIDDVK